jgi:hypothetical protein
MTLKQWKTLGLFAGLALLIALIDMDTAQKLVLIVGGVILLWSAPKIAGILNDVGV